MPAHLSFQQIATGLTVPERVLLFCLASNTDWQKAGVTHATAHHILVRGLTRAARCWRRCWGAKANRGGDAKGPGWQGSSSRVQHWSEQPCVRPLSAAHLAAGHNALRGSGPGQKHHTMMRWPKWVVLIARSTGSTLRAVRPFQPSHHAGCPTRSLHTLSAAGCL
jgi:hypothetical protein